LQAIFYVSIHAPAWGATQKNQCCAGTIISFNPRARVGRDQYYITTRQDATRFNPRARVGRDVRMMYDAAGLKRFNPRARVGRDRLD